MSFHDQKKIFEDTLNDKIEIIRRNDTCTEEDIIGIIRIFQENQMDAHIILAGQNGTGKSFLLLSFLKKYYQNDSSIMNNLILARHTRNDIIMYLLKNKNMLLGVDEWNQYLDYKEHSDLMQRHLISSLELARSKRIGIIGCIRDPRHIDHNYRNGKTTVIIWILDRYIEGGGYAAVLIANPSIEGYDRFGFDLMTEYLTDFDIIRSQIEKLPSFIGWMAVKNLSKELGTKLIDKYSLEKDKALAFAHSNKLIGFWNKGKISKEEMELNITALEKIDSTLPKYILPRLKRRKDELHPFTSSDD